jgi:hypothetical protein
MSSGMALPNPYLSPYNTPVKVNLFVPVPRILKGFDLRLGAFPCRSTEQDVVGRLAIKRGVEVNEVNTG